MNNAFQHKIPFFSPPVNNSCKRNEQSDLLGTKGRCTGASGRARGLWLQEETALKYG